MRLTWFRTHLGRFWRVYILLLCLAVPNYFTVELLELDGSADEDSEAEALICQSGACELQRAVGRDLPLPPHHDATSLPNPLDGFFSRLNGWTVSATLRLSRGARAAVLRALASWHVQSPLTAFAALDTPATDPA